MPQSSLICKTGLENVKPLKLLAGPLPQFPCLAFSLVVPKVFKNLLFILVRSDRYNENSAGQ